MRYGTWNILFEDQIGTVPDRLSGSFFITNASLAGYLPEDLDISMYKKWNVKEITAEEFLSLALKVNSTARLEDGKLVTDLPDILKI